MVGVVRHHLLGEAKDDFAVYDTLAAAISRRAAERGIAPIEDNFMGFMPVSRDLTKYHELFTMGGKVKTNKDVAQFLLNLNEGIPEKSFDELARQGIVRNNDTDGVMYGEHSPYGSVMLRAWEQKTPYPTLTGREPSGQADEGLCWRYSRAEDDPHPGNARHERG